MFNTYNSCMYGNVYISYFHIWRQDGITLEFENDCITMLLRVGESTMVLLPGLLASAEEKSRLALLYPILQFYYNP